MAGGTWRVPTAALVVVAASCYSGDRPSASRPDTTPHPAWTVSVRGIGPLVAGMTLEEARAALGSEITEPADSQCAYVTSENGPATVRLMVVDGRVARVEVHDTTVATAAGARVGDSEARVDSLYSGRVEVMPQKYSDGHYLTVMPATPADSQFRLVFETDAGRVTTFRAGLLPMVEWVEGCS